MNKGMSKKQTNSNNTFSVFANTNKFAALRGDIPKNEPEKKTEKKQDWKSSNVKKQNQSHKKTVNDQCAKKEEFCTGNEISKVENKYQKECVNNQKNDLEPKQVKKFFDPSCDGKFVTREQREHNKTDPLFNYPVEEKKIYVDASDSSNEMGNTMFLHSPWTVWIHKADCQVWTEESYTNIYLVNSIGSFWRFFNNFHAFDKVRNQFFIMRNKIKPIWEDNDNRNGGICSIKLDCYSKQGRIDIGVEIMMCICLLVMNETLIQSNEEINGISYSIKNRSVLIKLWCKNFTHKIAEKLPIGLFSKLDTMMRNMDRGNFNRKQLTDNKISIRYTQIKPEYDME